MRDSRRRSAKEVLEDHLRLRRERGMEEDLRRNYAEDVVLLTREGVHRGHDGVRELNRALRADVPDATYRYRTTRLAGEVAFLEWSARAPRGRRARCP